jgi:hypothetical protein
MYDPPVSKADLLGYQHGPRRQPGDERTCQAAYNYNGVLARPFPARELHAGPASTSTGKYISHCPVLKNCWR